ncbi:HepT-like ribonuclease domain-containing protein [Methanoculleus methanifontis]|uniref:HepT-like ribonuclease domain-containing protein n=1 Tax=Methanoculleus methanifontis TaxID=2584086 RepID=UPI0034619707
MSVRGREFFYDDEMAQVWVIHHLQIIGEAVRGISSEFRTANPDIPWSDIIGMRNVLIHHYFGIDRDAVWNVVEHDLPALKSQLQSLVRE